ncbi:MAG: hypothetical protein ACD_81C00050G0001 [uncultured bacterium]|uniref:Uncharacterized protein n=2 Tax=Candidatus Wolfeibacteriota TaxID=1752735 RepID=A0A0G1H9J0_9BACT|nr:MAG: hypothetical protein ACD_81C00050G0001 [uncultured bacterium]KKR12493.1 MAG: hypothetical protein UT41_C0001G0037 [Candidatus Wolfebacteria bacterium GW2011_GWC2_39_22]KKT43450.1 MAG: hypothetical protein UW32_C0001G0042 [Candidatus Wolfebacteria bacterium GW2011_GWE2_44_13]HBI25286.1 hypothetical protein [Candidatus Wolfebacteria bacterium]
MLQTYSVDQLEYAARKSAAWLTVAGIFGVLVSYYCGFFTGKLDARIGGGLIVYLLLVIMVTHFSEAREKAKFGHISGAVMEVVEGEVVGYHQGPLLYKFSELGERTLVPFSIERMTVTRMMAVAWMPGLITTYTVVITVGPNPHHLQEYYEGACHGVEFITGKVLGTFILQSASQEWPFPEISARTQKGEGVYTLTSSMRDLLAKELRSHGLLLYHASDCSVGVWPFLESKKGCVRKSELM